MYGTLVDIHDVYEKTMKETIEQNTFHHTSITLKYATHLDKDAAAVGGALFAFDEYSNDHKEFWKNGI
jgi:hypothetical protein